MPHTWKSEFKWLGALTTRTQEFFDYGTTDMDWELVRKCTLGNTPHHKTLKGRQKQNKHTQACIPTHTYEHRWTCSYNAHISTWMHTCTHTQLLINDLRTTYAARCRKNTTDFLVLNDFPHSIDFFPRLIFYFIIYFTHIICYHKTIKSHSV